MHSRKFPVTRRDRFRLLQAQFTNQSKDRNQNEATSPSEDFDELTVTAPNSRAANGEAGGRAIELQRLESEDDTDGRQRAEDTGDLAPTRIGVNDEQATEPSLLDIVAAIFGIVFFAYDVYTDGRLAYTYYQESQSWWFGLTTMFIVLPAAVMTSFNLCFYMMDMFVVKDDVSCVRWLLRATFSMLMLGPLIRMFETLDYALRSYCSRDKAKRTEYANKYIDAEVDNALIGMMEAFMEAGPQVVLQLCVFEVIGWTTDTTHLVTHQLKSIASSLWMLAWAMVRFQKAVVTSQSRNQSFGICRSFLHFVRGSVCLCLWRLFTISGRVLALATFALCFSWRLILFCSAHYIIMLIWICKQPTHFFMYVDENGEKKHDRCLEAAFKGFAAFIHIFAFLNLIGGHLRLRAVMFYSIVYIENCMLIGLWYFYGQCSKTGEVGSAVILAVVLGGFWIGIAFMGMHYMCCHANRKDVTCCLENSQMYFTHSQ